MNPDHVEENINAHRLEELIDLCNTHNKTSPGYAIDIDKYQTWEELVFSLWEHDINVGEFGFGDSYDDIMKSWTVGNQDEDNIFGIETNAAYLTYLNSDKIIDFLYYSLLLINHGHYLKDKNIPRTNLERFNEFWTEMGKAPIEDYTELRKILVSNTLTKIELCCLLWECENYGIFNIGLTVWDLIRRIRQ